MPSRPAPPNHSIGDSPSTPAVDTAPAALTIAQVVDRVFTRFDANSDASISLTELLSGLKADDRMHADLTTLLTQIAADLDNNGDSNLGTVELTTAVDALDLNQNGLVDFAEVGPAATDNANVALVGLLIHRGHDLPDHAV